MEKKKVVADIVKMPAVRFKQLSQKLGESYWVAEPEDIITANLQLLASNEKADLAIDARYYEDRGATLVTVYAADHPGLFYRIAGAIHLAGGNIIDARIHTSRDGMALDNFLIQDPLGRPLHEASQIERLKAGITETLTNRGKMDPKIQSKPVARMRAETFRIAPAVLIDNNASNRFTVIEVNAQDRPALLNNLAEALFLSKAMLHSAHIATYGERAVDTFYVTDLLGGKITNKLRLKNLEKRLLEAAAGDLEAKSRMVA